MFNVFNEIDDEIPRALDTKFFRTYSTIDREILQQICDFISIFDEVIDKLSDDSQPTIHRVIPLRQHLIDVCSMLDNDNDNDNDNSIHLKIDRHQSTSIYWVDAKVSADF